LPPQYLTTRKEVAVDSDPFPLDDCSRTLRFYFIFGGSHLVFPVPVYPRFQHSCRFVPPFPQFLRERFNSGTLPFPNMNPSRTSQADSSMNQLPPSSFFPLDSSPKLWFLDNPEFHCKEWKHPFPFPLILLLSLIL